MEIEDRSSIWAFSEDLVWVRLDVEFWDSVFQGDRRRFCTVILGKKCDKVFTEEDRQQGHGMNHLNGGPPD